MLVKKSIRQCNVAHLVTKCFSNHKLKIPKGYCILVDDDGKQLLDDNGKILIALCE